VSRLVFVTQQVDPEHPALAATVPKIRALAERFDEVAVLASGAVEGALPANCELGLYGSSSRARRGTRYTAALERELRRRPEAVLVHMVPLLAVLAWPLARPRGVPLLLWFTHWKPSRTLVLAERASKAVLTVDRRTFPLPSRKLHAIGHGIDLTRFACVERAQAERLRVVALGRTSPAKGYETIVRAARLAGVELELRGPSLTEDERRHRAELGAVEEPLPRAELPALFARTSVLVNNTRAGGLDKVVFEAGLSCVPVLAPGFAGLLDERLRFPQDDAAALARHFGELAALSREERTAIGRELRERVLAAHTVDTWAEGVLAAARR
jgi:glycosyltransferase involved in cell wall biosynthesis